MWILSMIFIPFNSIVFASNLSANPNPPQVFLVDGIEVQIPPYNDSIVPKRQFDINTAGRVQRIIRQYFPGTKDYIQVSINVRDTIGRGLAKVELSKALREMLEKVAAEKKLPSEVANKMLADFDREFGLGMEELEEGGI